MRKKLLLCALLVNSTIATITYAQEAPRRPPPENRQENRVAPPVQPIQTNQPPLRQRPNDPQLPAVPEQQLQAIITNQNIISIDQETLNLPTIDSPKAQLGKQLFFTKNLGGDQSAACVSCHHPALGGGDNLSLSVGVAAVNELDQSSHDLLGHGRFNDNGVNNLPAVPRNAPTIFNIGLLTRGLFWDSRVETARNGGIFTPDSEVNEQGQRRPDTNLPLGTTLAAAQARFPVTSRDEMRGEFLTNSENEELRNALAQRFDNSNEGFNALWPSAFANVYETTEISFSQIADAIGEYERSMVFINNPWQEYLAGNTDALSNQQKSGAVLFFSPTNQGGAGCVACHRGNSFSDSRHHLVAFPQIGAGKGNESTTATSQDFGRENITNNPNDKYHFRTASLLNVAATAPYGHSGAYQTLEEVVNHYNNPRASIERLFAAQGNVPFSDGEAAYCQLPQIALLIQKNNLTCESVFPDAYQNSIAVTEYLQQARNNDVNATAPFRARVRLSPLQVDDVVAFLHALTDPCVESRECLSPWIVDENDVASFPDDQPLVAHDKDITNL